MIIMRSQRLHERLYDSGDVAETMERADVLNRATEAAIAKSAVFGASLRDALSQGRPGQWASDHRAETEHYTGWNYIAIRTLCEQVAGATVEIYSDGDSAAQKRAKRRLSRSRLKSYGFENESSDALPDSHPLNRLQRRPNPRQSGASFRYMQALQLSLTGSCLVWNVGNQRGLTVERYVIPTAMAEPVGPGPGFPNGGYRIGRLSRHGLAAVDQGFVEVAGLMSLTNKVLAAEHVQVIRWPHPLYYDDGMSPLAAGALWSDTALQVDQSRWSHLKNGIDPSIGLSPGADVKLDEQAADRAAAKINAKYGGPQNAGKVFIWPPGTTVERLSESPKDMSYGEAFTQYRDTLCMLHRMPRGLLDAGSYASLYAALEQYRILAVQPLLDLLAEEETEQLAPQFGSGLTVEMLAPAIDDHERIERELATDIAAGAVTVDEVRAVRGRDKWGGAAGEKVAGNVAVGAVPWQAQQGQPVPPSQKQPLVAAAEAPTQAAGGTAAAGDDDAIAAGSSQEIQVTEAAVLNGAQIQAAVEIVRAVAAGEVPRDAGLGQLRVLFNLDEQKALEIMGSAGTNQPTTPNPNPAQAAKSKPIKRRRRSASHKSRPTNRIVVNGHWSGYP